MNKPNSNVSMIVAVDDRGVIGVDGKIPWRLKADMDHFVRVTTGVNTLWGRKTWDGLPTAAKKRLVSQGRVFVLTRTPEEAHRGGLYDIAVSSIATAIELSKGNKLVVCGGAEVYALALPYVSEVFLTLVETGLEEIPANATLFPGVMKVIIPVSVFSATEVKQDADNQYPATLYSLYK